MVTLDRRRARAGADLAFADSGGEGRAVLFTHGAGLDHTMFDAQTSALAAAGYRVLVWDMRGHGQSTLSPERRFTAADALDDLAALCEECGIERVVPVGHSLGGNLS